MSGISDRSEYFFVIILLTMDKTGKIDFQGKNLVNLIKKTIDELKLDEISENSLSKIDTIDTIDEFSTLSVDIEGSRILAKVKNAFSSLHYFPNFKGKSEKSINFEHIPGICLISWNEYDINYEEEKGKTPDLQKVKDFMRVASLYYDRLTEAYNDAIKNRESSILIYPIVYIKERPAFTAMTETTRYMEKFVTHPNVAPLQVVFVNRDRDFVGLVAIKSGISIAKLMYKVSGIRLHRNLKSALMYILKNLTKENDDIDSDSIE